MLCLPPEAEYVKQPLYIATQSSAAQYVLQMAKRRTVGQVGFVSGWNFNGFSTDGSLNLFYNRLRPTSHNEASGIVAG